MHWTPTDSPWIGSCSRYAYSSMARRLGERSSVSDGIRKAGFRERMCSSSASTVWRPRIRSVSQKVLTGRIDDVLRRLDELLWLNVSVRTEVATVCREARSPDYPLAALQQLARNAVMHRSYEGTHAPVHVDWYSNRVEIRNPGGLFGQVTSLNFGEGTVDYRNPLVAEIMQHLRFAQRFGLGVPLARKALEENGNPEPEFDFQPTLVTATIRAAP